MEFRDGRISTVEPTDAEPTVPLLAPGLVDLQVNGIDGYDCNLADRPGLEAIGAALARHGVTSWMPTLVSSPIDGYRRRLGELTTPSPDAPFRPRRLGVHLEGPFLGERPGVHDSTSIVPIDLDFLDGLPDMVRMVTLAPELDDAPTAVELLVRRGVTVALGHTDASASEVTAAVDRGARVVTHCWNAMTGIHHREPGPVAAALLDDRLVVGLIGDGHHVHPDIMRLTWRAKPARGVMLVSDLVASAGIGRRGHRSGVTAAPPVDDAGRLSGASAGLDRGLRIAVDSCDVRLADAIAAVTTVPLSVLGITDRGRIAEGQLADVCVMDDDLAPRTTIVGGHVAWNRSDVSDPSPTDDHTGGGGRTPP